MEIKPPSTTAFERIPRQESQEKPGEPLPLRGDTVTIEGSKEPPMHLSRELLAEIQKKGIKGAGPLTAEQKSYLEQKFASPATMEAEETGKLFGIGGVLMPDSAGRIKHMAFQFGNVEFNRPLPEKTQKALIGVYETLFKNMDSRTRFSIVAANQEGIDMLKNAVKESGMENPERVKIIDGKADKGFSIWIRDSMIPVDNKDGTTTTLIQDRTYWPGPEDAKIPPLFSQNNDDVKTRPHPALRIDGGNVLSNQSEIIVGHDSVNHTTALLQELAKDPKWKSEIVHFYEIKSGNEVQPEGAPGGKGKVTMNEMWHDIAPMVFESEFERKVFVIGKDDPATAQVEEQPAFHIDMAVTPIGNRKFLVGDPGMAINVFNSLAPEERVKVNASMNRECGFPPENDMISTLIKVNGSAEHQQNFDNVAQELKGEGYDIERIPCMIGLRTTWSLPYLTYNNCIQENYTDDNGKQVKKVYLPTYGCEPLEKIAMAAYEREGFQVVPLKMAAVSILEGAIRCSSYPLARTEVPEPQK
jgi:hypothetical protein